VHSRLEAASFAVRHRLPDLWSGEDLLAGAGAARHAAARETLRPGSVRPGSFPAPGIPQAGSGRQAASMRQAAGPVPAGSTVRPMKQRRAQYPGKRALPGSRLPVATGQGVSAG
jgi:hypothetical protein